MKKNILTGILSGISAVISILSTIVFAYTYGVIASGTEGGAIGGIILVPFMIIVGCIALGMFLANLITFIVVKPTNRAGPIIMAVISAMGIIASVVFLCLLLIR